MPSASELERQRQEDLAEVGGNAAKEMARLLERVERLEDEKQGIADDIKDVWAEAKANGYDVKMMRQMKAERKLTADQRQLKYGMEETYRSALKLKLLED